MTTQQQRSQLIAESDDENDERNARALQLVREWLAEDSGYDVEVFPILKAELEADRVSYRRRFKE